MKKYYAIQNVQEYKIGDEVPSSKGAIWIVMYDFPPVRVVEVPDPVVDSSDLNKDGRVDEKDVVIANKVISAVSKKKKIFGGK